MARFILSHKTFNDCPCDFELTIRGIKDMLEQGWCSMKSNSFPWNEYPEISTRVKFQLKDRTAAFISLHPEDARPIAAIKHFPAIYYVVREVRGKNREHVVSYNRLFGWKPFDFLRREDVKLMSGSALAHPAFNANDAVVIRVYVEPPAMATRVYSYEGFLSWSLENFSRRKLKGLDGLYDEESPYFYTGPKGYRVRVYVRAGATVLHFFVYFCAGAFDEHLETSFPHCTTVTLLHRKNPEGNVVHRVKRDIKMGPIYRVDIAVDEEVKNVIEDDTLFYSVSIRPILTS